MSPPVKVGYQLWSSCGSVALRCNAVPRRIFKMRPRQRQLIESLDHLLPFVKNRNRNGNGTVMLDTNYYCITAFTSPTLACLTCTPDAAHVHSGRIPRDVIGAIIAQSVLHNPVEPSQVQFSVGAVSVQLEGPLPPSLPSIPSADRREWRLSLLRYWRNHSETSPLSIGRGRRYWKGYCTECCTVEEDSVS